jgi:hypothetical protein
MIFRESMKISKAIRITSIALTIAGGYYLKYRIDDSKIVRIISVETKIEKETGFKNTRFLYIHRDEKIDSKSIMEKFEQPLAKIIGKNGCIKMKLTFSDWNPWDKYRGLDSFEEVECLF